MSLALQSLDTNHALEGALRERVALGPAGPGSCSITVAYAPAGWRAAIDGSIARPTASVFKVPVLVELGRAIDDGRLRWNERIVLSEADRSLGSGIVVRLDDGLALTVRDLAVLMIQLSDNTATDMLVHRLGLDAVNKSMGALGLPTTVTRVDTDALLRSILGPVAPYTLSRHEMLPAALAHGPDLSAAAWSAETGNASAADEMAELFFRLVSSDGLAAIGVSEPTRRELVAILRDQQLVGRIPRKLPPTQPVVHKTGTMPGLVLVANDAGVIELPAGPLVVSIFTTTPMPFDQPDRLEEFETEVERQMGSLALLAYQAALA